MTSVPGLWIDWFSDGFGAHSQNDCTADLLSITYSRGAGAEITGAAQAGSCTIRLRNTSGLYSPDNAAGALYGKLHDGIRVWFGANEDGTLNDKGDTVRGRFAGRVVDVTPVPAAGSVGGTPEVEITCEDALGWYGRTPVSLSVAATSSDFTPPLPA